MQSAVSRPPILGGTGAPSSSSHRIPRKSSSFLSLRRERDKPQPVLDSYATLDPSATTSSTHSEAYPKTPVARPLRIKTHRNTSDKTSHAERNAPHGSPQSSYAFPTCDDTEDLVSPTTPKQYSRTRSRTGPSGRSYPHASPVPALRFSGSSSTQHTETPPHTPVDLDPSQESFERFPAVVAAPISGVEMMDALVDGMNGGDVVLLNATGISNRARFNGIPGHHPLYQPPLPTPPPGVVLGGGKCRRSKAPIRSNHSSDSDSSQDYVYDSSSRPRRRRPRPIPVRASSNPAIGPLPSASVSTHKAVKPYTPTSSSTAPRAGSVEISSVVVPSISDIIRAHAPDAQLRSRPSTARSSYYAHSQGHGSIHREPEPELVGLEDELDLISRSSIDSVADEVQRTLRTQMMSSPGPPPAPPSSFPKRHSTISDNASIYSPRSDPGVGSSSVYSFSVGSHCCRPSPIELNSLNSLPLAQPASGSQKIAEYLRSARLTTLLRLTRSPHASQDNPLTVSFSDLGSPTGHPVVVFLGLGCVRHVMGLYDEMAEILNLRLITIDRWGLGRTEPRSKSAKGIIQWASVVEEVLDLLNIEECSVMAHSAGAPYALSFVNKVPGRIRGDVCLLAPWVGGTESNGYKWLKYVPNGILKTAQAAEWKVQAWMLGKPPTIAYQGIEYHAPAAQIGRSPDKRASLPRSTLDVQSPHSESIPRPSIGSSTFSEYDDLRDFDGRFESRSTLGAGIRASMPEGKSLNSSRKPSKGFLTRWKGSSQSPQHDEKPLPGGRKLKALRSMGSLKGTSRKTEPTTSSVHPPSFQIEVSFGLDDRWARSNSTASVMEDEPVVPRLSTASHGPYGRPNGRRSISFTAPKPTLSLPTSPSFTTSKSSSFTASVAPGGNAYQAALGNALIAASHAESAKGTHNDLLQILNHENHSWGFSYSSYPHIVKVWYGDKDEKIAETAVKWMLRTMGEERCLLTMIKGADHGLLYRSGVVVEVFEHLLSFWKGGTPTLPPGCKLY